MPGFTVRIPTLLFVLIVTLKESTKASFQSKGEEDEESTHQSSSPETSSIDPLFIHSNLRTPRIELVHPKGSEGAELHVYNPDLINASIPLEAIFICTVNSGHLERDSGRWQIVSRVDLYQESETEIWQVPPELYNVFPGVLQTRTILKVAYEVEGVLSCEDRLDLGLVSNSLLIRFNRREAFVLRLGKPRGDINVAEFLEEYKVLWSYKMDARLLEDEGSEILIRISYVKPSSEAENSKMLDDVKKVTEMIAKDRNLTLVYARSTRFCNPERVDGFLWPETPAGKTAIPDNPCLDSEGSPTPLRRCLGGFSGGVYWEKAPERPEGCSEIEERTRRLQKISSSMEEKGSFEKLEKEIETDTPLVPFEISLVANALTSYKNEMKNSSSLAEAPSIFSLASVVDAVLRSGRSTINAADAISGSSDAILVAVDELIAASSTGGQSEASTPRFSALAIPIGTGVRGVAVYPNGTSPETLTPVSRDESIAKVLGMSPRVAALLLQDNDDVGLALTLYEDDSFFGSANDTAVVQGPIIGLSLFQDGRRNKPAVPQTPINVLLIFPKGDRKGNCSFWDLDDGGKWSSEGCTSISPSELPGRPNVDACLCTHLTHFTMLIFDFPTEEEDSEYLSQGPSENENEENKTVVMNKSSSDFGDEHLLNLITVIGCSISLACLGLTFLYASCSPQWRRGVYRKIELNLFFSIALLDAAELIVASFRPAPTQEFRAVCVSMGAILHYSVLATFTWMLVVAALQSLRLSPGTILDARRRAGTHLLLKSSIFAWGLPAIPVVSTLCLGTDLYVQRPRTAFCYPRGIAFYAGVLFPVALAVFVNLLVFAWLLRILCCDRGVTIRVHRVSERTHNIRRFCYCLFLFFLLGLNWIAGLALEVSRSNKSMYRILSYLFCSTATLHGSLLFIFFVACEPRLGDKLSEDLKRRTNMMSIRFSNARVSVGNVLERRSVMFPNSESKVNHILK